MTFDFKKMPRLLLFAILCCMSCVADPWPEPDSMEDNGAEGPQMNGDENDDPGSLSDADTDADTDADADADADSDKVSDNFDAGSEQETDTATEPEKSSDGDTDSVWDVDSDQGTDVELDAGEDESDAGAPDWEKVFVSTPGASGFATIVGLPGTVGGADKVTIETTRGTYSLRVGRDGGFAKRIPVDRGADMALVVAAENGETHQTAIVSGDLNERFDEGIIAGGGQSRLNDTLLAVNGSGSHLDGGYFVVGGNLTEASGSMTVVECEDQLCIFSLIMSAASGDELDIFLVRNTGALSNADARAGTVVETLFAL